MRMSRFANLGFAPIDFVSFRFADHRPAVDPIVVGCLVEMVTAAKIVGPLAVVVLVAPTAANRG